MAQPETPTKHPSKRARTPVEALAPSSQGVALPDAPKARKKPGPPKGQGGRPCTYDKSLAIQMCELLSEGIPLREICRMDGMPAWRTVYDWIGRDAELAASIARAREMGYDALAEQCLIISNTPVMGKKTVYSSGAEEDKDSVTVTEEDMLGHRKLQIETRLKLLAKWDPKRFGDRVQLSGDAENPIRVEAESQAERMMAALLQNLEMKRALGEDGTR